MKKKLVSHLINFVLILCAVIALTIHIYKIPVWQIITLNEYNKNNILEIFHHNKENIGILKKISTGNGIQRKFKSKYVFDTINEKDFLYRNDSIITDSHTSATIELKNGEKIHISPNSMITLTNSIDEWDWLGISKKPKIIIMSGDANVVSVNNTISPEVKVYKKAIIKKPTIEYSLPKELIVKNESINPNSIPSFEFKKDEPKREVASIEPPIEPIKKTIRNINLKTIIAGAVNNSNDLGSELYRNINYLFTWDKGNNNNTIYEFFIYDFVRKAIIKKIYTKNNFITYDQFLIPNQTIAIVKELENKEIVGKSNVSKVDLKFNPPTIINPQLNENIDLSIKGKNQLIISWKHTNFTEEYELQIANNEDFSEPTVVRVKNNYFLTKINEGKYFIRVKSINHNFDSEWSESRSFNIKNSILKQ